MTGTYDIWREQPNPAGLRGATCAGARHMRPPDVSADPTSAPRGDARPPRRVVMQLGVEWTVTECDGAKVPGARGSRCLIFSSAEAIRRVWDVPADWHTLSDAALFALSWRR